jgi:phosphatidylserine/phosphatidylglycerophosphate/cardiolipin synthase-like enzyme
MKRQSLWSIIPLCIVLSPLNQITHAADLTLNNTPTQVCFSPKGGCTEAIVSVINGAKTEVLVQAYSLTSSPIARALLHAHKRKIKVDVLLDKSQRKKHYRSTTLMANAGIPIFIDDEHSIAHNKVMIIDKEIVITGSFNFTRAAEEKHAENLLIIKNRDLARVYVENWEKHKRHSEAYRRR